MLLSEKILIHLSGNRTLIIIKIQLYPDNLVIQGEITLDKLNVNGESISATEDDLSFLENIPVKTDKKISMGNDVIADENDLYALKYYWPVGTIVAYEGFLEDIEKMEGWAVCDGKNGTPDLTGRFIRGTDDYSNVGIVGGYDIRKIKPSQLPKHKHVYDLLVQTPLGIDIGKWKNKINELYDIPVGNITEQNKKTKNGLGTFLRPSYEDTDFENDNDTLISSCIDYTDPIKGKPVYFSPCKKKKRNPHCRSGYNTIKNDKGERNCKSK